jgi:predicted enzyme related to lactoylglutathione lyase
MAREPQKAVGFYSKVFGWTFQLWGGSTMEYWLISTGDDKEPGINGGLGRGEPVKGRILSIGVKDLDGTVKKITETGGKILMARSPIPGVGWFAAFEDPTGNQMGIMQDDPAAK